MKTKKYTLGLHCYGIKLWFFDVLMEQKKKKFREIVCVFFCILLNCIIFFAVVILIIQFDAICTYNNTCR